MGMLNWAAACMGAWLAWPMSSCPGPATVLTKSVNCVLEAALHAFCTSTGTRAQLVASAVSVPALSTLRMVLYAEGTSNCATSCTVMPRRDRTSESLYVQLTPWPLNVASTEICIVLTSVTPADGETLLRLSAVSEMVTLLVALSPCSATTKEAAPAEAPWYTVTPLTTCRLVGVRLTSPFARFTVPPSEKPGSSDSRVYAPANCTRWRTGGEAHPRV